MVEYRINLDTTPPTSESRRLPLAATPDANGVGPAPLSLSVRSSDAQPFSPEFPLTCDSKIYLSLFGEVIACDLKTLGPDPTLIIQLLKTTQSERANYMIVGASYRRSGFPQSAKAIMETMIEELGKRGVSDSELKPGYLFLAGCESDLVKLSKAAKNSEAISKHSAAAQMYLQKVFGKADATKDHDGEAENELMFFESSNPRSLHAQVPLSDTKHWDKDAAAQMFLQKTLNHDEDKENKRSVLDNRKFPVSQNVASVSDRKEKDHIRRMKREIQILRDQNAQQVRRLTQLQSSKRKFEEDFYFERNLRMKYQDRVESVQEMLKTKGC